MRILLLSCFCDLVLCLGNCFSNLSLVSLELLYGFLMCLVNDSSHILHIFKECYAESLAWKLLATVHRPISILKIVVLY